MPIETNNLVLYKSERLTDTSDGGGKYSGQVVIDGESNIRPDPANCLHQRQSVKATKGMV